jgi:hypothetical protein
MQSTSSHHIPIRSILISFRLRPRLSSCPFPLDFPTKILCAILCSPLREIFPAHLIFLDFHGGTTPSGPGPPHYRGFTITLRHTTLGRTPLDEWSARRRDLYLRTHDTHKRQTSMSPAGFKPAIPESERRQIGTLDRHWVRLLDLITRIVFGEVQLGILVAIFGVTCCLHIQVRTGPLMKVAIVNFEMSVPSTKLCVVTRQKKWIVLRIIIEAANIRQPRNILDEQHA